MPGIHLKDTERHLKGFWDNLSTNPNLIYLKNIKIGDNPIRGLANSDIEFKYPITLLCGKNGSGKTTFLQLAVLAFDNQNHNYRKTFKDFFFKTRFDPDNNNVKITWTYSSATRDPLSILKGLRKWMHYERRPKKSVIFISVSKAIAMLGLKNKRHMDRASDTDFKSLNNEYLKYLSFILERPYTLAHEHPYEDLSRCQQGINSYSCFNMGVGEKAIIHLLRTFQDAPENSLIGIDEIEIGIHPSALRKLADVIQDIVIDKKLQVIITTHSKDLIDSFPREARILVERTDSTTTTINSPTTTYAMSKISNKPEAELLIFCEDDFAKYLILYSAGNLKNRIGIVVIGSKTELVKAVKIHNLSKQKQKSMIIWDGDVSDEEIQIYFNQSELETTEIPHFKLPNTNCPEKAVLDHFVSNNDAIKCLAARLICQEYDMKNIIDECNTLTNPHDDFVYTISSSIGEDDIKHVMKIIIQSFLATNSTFNSSMYKIIKDAFSKYSL